MIRSLVRDNRGQELVEYALTLPILLLLVIGIMEFGVTIFVYNTMANAAREGARVGAVMDGTLDEIREPVKQAVVDRTGGLSLSPDDNITVVLTATESPTDTIQVTVHYTHTMITGLMVQAVGGDAKLHMSSQASMRREAPLRNP
ncbi:MAG: TadE family protein [Chloroflexota bacterium]|nr:TadE family protein [Chloroflexota bacterium]